MKIKERVIVILCFLIFNFSTFSQKTHFSAVLLDSFAFNFEFGSYDLECENCFKNSKYFSGDSLTQNYVISKVLLNGYTDTLGSSKFNVALANARMVSVRKAIQLRANIKPSDIKLVNMNEQRKYDLLNDSLFRKVDVLIYGIQKGVKYSMNLHFINGTDEIYGTISQKDLDNLYQILEINKNISVILEGHVCCGSTYELSLKRALRVKNELIKRGILHSRINCKGFGFSRPLMNEVSDKHETINRRVEVVFNDF